LPSSTVATLALVYALTRGERPQPISAGTAASMDTYCRLMIFKSWI
jgi:hypothetical protein